MPTFFEFFYRKCRKNGELSLENDAFLLKNRQFFCNWRYRASAQTSSPCSGESIGVQYCDNKTAMCSGGVNPIYTHTSEDPSVFVDHRGNYHMLVNALPGIRICITNDGFCIKNDVFCILNDEFRKGAAFRSSSRGGTPGQKMESPGLSRVSARTTRPWRSRTAPA